MDLNCRYVKTANSVVLDYAIKTMVSFHILLFLCFGVFFPVSFILSLCQNFFLFLFLSVPHSHTVSFSVYLILYTLSFPRSFFLSLLFFLFMGVFFTMGVSRFLSMPIPLYLSGSLSLSLHH